MAVKYPDVTVQLTGEDGNAFYILGAVSNAIRCAHDEESAAAYRKEAMSGDYDNLLAVTMNTVNVL